MKSRKKYVVYLIGILGILAGITAGCSGVGKRREIVLNERQIEILKSYHLPADYEELTSGQRNAITSIEAILEYLEEKYGGTFCYLGYVPSGEDGPQETLTAYCKEDKIPKTVTVIRNYVNGEYVYEDDYEPEN